MSEKPKFFKTEKSNRSLEKKPNTQPYRFALFGSSPLDYNIFHRSSGATTPSPTHIARALHAWQESRSEAHGYVCIGPGSRAMG
jgi:hypothetical protein